MTIHDHFRIGSVTKTMTATVALQLIDEGTLSLEGKLADYFPEIPAAEQISIRNLLNMTSGLFDLLDDESFLPQVFADPAKIWTTDELLAVSLAHPAEFEPGARFNYSSTNYVLLGSIVETVTGNTLAQEMQDRLFDPLGMSQSSYPTSPAMPDPFAHGYASPPNSGSATPVPGSQPGYVDITEVDPSVYGAGGAVISTADDLRVWLGALLDGSLVSPALQEERMRFPPPEKPGDTSYGLGIANYDGAIGHDGSALGYQAFAALDQESGISVISLANLKPAPDDSEPANEIAAAVLEAMR
jgi:D-alanyl-D-alanine carboxypeptidase